MRRVTELGAWILGISSIAAGLSTEATAQISFGGFAEGSSVCAAGASPGTTVLIAQNDECTDDIDGVTYSAPTTLSIGPGGATNFNPANGNATFGATSTFTGPTNLNGTTTVAGPTTFTSSPTFGAGFTVSGGQTVNFGNNRLQNVGAPTADGDAANKKYVDDANATQNVRITNVETKNGEQDVAIAGIVTVNNTQQTQITNLTTATNTLQNQVNEITTDVNGLQSDVNHLRDRDNELAEGIAISLALDAPVLRSGQTIAFRGGWGNFDGSNAAGVTAAGAISQNVAIDAGVGWGTTQGTVAGKAGMTIGW